MRSSYPIIILSVYLLSACKSSEERQLQHAHDLAVNGKYKEAVLEYSKLINQRRLLQPAYYYRGNCYMELQEYSKALEDFNKIISFYQQGDVTFIPNYSNPLIKPAKDEVSVLKAFNKRGQVYYYMDNLQDSYDDFQRCINQEFSEQSSCYLWQGYIFLKKNEMDKACRSFDYALQAAVSGVDQLQAKKLIQENCK